MLMVISCKLDACHPDHEIFQSTVRSTIKKHEVTEERLVTDLTTRGHKHDAPMEAGLAY